MFLEFIWKPFGDAGPPESDRPAVRGTLDQRPLASVALVAGFAPTMAKVAEVASGEELCRTRKS